MLLRKSAVASRGDSRAVRRTLVLAPALVSAVSLLTTSGALSASGGGPVSPPRLLSAKSDSTAASTADASASQHEQILKSLTSLRTASSDSSRLQDEVKGLSKFLQETMVQVSYPVLIPAVAGGNPVTLATPNLDMYKGHFPEPKLTNVVNAVNKIGNQLTLLKQDIASAYVPPDKTEAVQPLLDDINQTLASVQAAYNPVQAQVKADDPDVDAEVMAEKLADMQRELTTIDTDLKSVFQVVNLQNVSKDTVQALIGLRVLGRNAQWLEALAGYLRDDAKRLNPIGAVVQDAQNQGWLVMGVPTKTLDQVYKHPYIPEGAQKVDKRMQQIGSYISALQQDVQAVAVPPERSSSVQPLLDNITSLINDVQSRYTDMQSSMKQGNYDQRAISNQSQSIVQDMEQVQKLQTKIAHTLLDGNSIL